MRCDKRLKNSLIIGFELLYAKGIVHNQSKSNVIDAGGMIKKLRIKRKRKKHLDYLIDYFFFDKYSHSLVTIKKKFW